MVGFLTFVFRRCEVPSSNWQCVLCSLHEISCKALAFWFRIGTFCWGSLYRKFFWNVFWNINILFSAAQRQLLLMPLLPRWLRPQGFSLSFQSLLHTVPKNSLFFYFTTISPFSNKEKQLTSLTYSIWQLTSQLIQELTLHFCTLLSVLLPLRAIMQHEKALRKMIKCSFSVGQML